MALVALGAAIHAGSNLGQRHLHKRQKADQRFGKTPEGITEDWKMYQIIVQCSGD